MNYSLIVPVLGGLLLVIGAFLLRRGGWPRRVGQTAHCPRCDYILAGESSRCPECGTVVTAGNVIRGERPRRGGMALLGAALMLFGLGLVLLFTTGVTRSIDWNRHKPLAWLLHDLRSGNSAAVTPAWDEIQRRDNAHLLSETDKARVAAAALPVQGTGALPYTLDQSVATFVADEFLNGKLTAAQADRFFASRMTVGLSVRPEVGSASRVPYWIVGTGAGLPSWWHRTKVVEYQLDDGPAEAMGNASGGGLGGGWTSGSSLPPVSAPGRHRLRVKVETAINPDRGTGLSWNENAPAARRVAKNLVADFQVVEGQTPIQTVSEPDAAVLQALLKVYVHPTASRSADFDLDVETNGVPVDVAFDVLLRFGGKEYPAGSVAIHKGVASGLHSLVHALQNLPPDWPAHADVILRSSEAVARDTVDMTRIWKGEIVLPNVPLPATAATPATAPFPIPGAHP